MSGNIKYAKYANYEFDESKYLLGSYDHEETINGRTYVYYRDVYKIRNDMGEVVRNYIGLKRFDIGAYEFINESKGRDGGGRSRSRSRTKRRRLKRTSSKSLKIKRKKTI